jgi:pimeloyl-ACP methyl ester carboxylesterase
MASCMCRWRLSSLCANADGLSVCRGSKRNWTSLSKGYARALNRPVYAVDLRNHGRSPATAPHTYPAMASDISRFLRTHQLEDVQLLGHSMGGKAAMAYALGKDARVDGRLGKLVVEDTAPSRETISAGFREYVVAMRRINALGLKTKKEAEAALRHTEPVCPLLLVLWLYSRLPTRIQQSWAFSSRTSRLRRTASASVFRSISCYSTLPKSGSSLRLWTSAHGPGPHCLSRAQRASTSLLVLPYPVYSFTPK